VVFITSGTRANIFTVYKPLGKLFCFSCLMQFNPACLSSVWRRESGRVIEESSLSTSTLSDDVRFSFTTIIPLGFNPLLWKTPHTSIYNSQHYVGVYHQNLRMLHFCVQIDSERQYNQQNTGKLWLTPVFDYSPTYFNLCSHPCGRSLTVIVGGTEDIHVYRKTSKMYIDVHNT